MLEVLASFGDLCGLQTHVKSAFDVSNHCRFRSEQIVAYCWIATVFSFVKVMQDLGHVIRTQHLFESIHTIILECFQKLSVQLI